MITFHTGSIFNSKCEALVNPVNCLGVSGAGLAKQFAKRFPRNQQALAAYCRKSQLQPGGSFLFEQDPWDDPKFIINFATKDHWKNPSQLDWIVGGLEFLAIMLEANKIKSIAIPALGCGYGGLDWLEVRPLIIKSLDGFTVEVYEPVVI